MLEVAATLLGAALATMFALRKKLLASAFNQRTGALLVTTMAAVVVSRLAATLQHLSFASMVAQDLLLIAVVATAVALTLLPWLWLLAGLALVGVGVALAAPTLAGLALTVVVSAVPFLTMFALDRRVEKAASDRLP